MRKILKYVAGILVLVLIGVGFRAGYDWSVVLPACAAFLVAAIVLINQLPRKW
jgi:hypothetical protein